ncbi:hypothetical protein RHGRI_016346 [Rhododendron griersonianum]|uniref:UDP-glycosyltransferases domain-containing protein n=1 Tax=Rhododendron griersonianum TaxID=479676 RepID=A0AAV6JTT1_9ERIC|nr:hypothetical protein RHGRI_016346 [Rhododendron griersonianum]
MDSGSRDDRSGCLSWLDNQPPGYVLFISFGSGGTLSYDQLNELALGLEMSEQRFIWVVRSPSDTAGFVDRTKGYGLLVPSWAPQAQILSHRSTGGFLTHCGWNSALESVVHGVPLIVWPLYTEQKMNAVMLTEEVKVALRPKVGENGIIGRVEIAKVVKGLMEGEEGKQVQTRMRDLKEAAERVLSADRSSTRSLAELAQKWKNKISNEN